MSCLVDANYIIGCLYGNRSPEGVIADVLPGVESGFNARTRVHEYGGGESIIADGVVYWSNFKCAKIMT